MLWYHTCETHPDAIIYKLSENSLVLSIISAQQRVLLEWGEISDCYDFFIPWAGEMYLRAGYTSLKIEEPEMVCVNPWQLRRLLACGKDSSLIRITCKAAYINSLYLELYGKCLNRFRNQPIPVENRVYTVIDNLLCESRGESPGKHLMLDNLIYELFINVLRHAVLAAAVVEEKQGLCFASAEAIVRYIQKNYDKPITSKAIAEHVNISKCRMSRQFRELVGISPREYLAELRIANAKRMLVETDLDILKIAGLCGFVTHSHFSDAFKKKTGLSPGAFRKQSRVSPIA